MAKELARARCTWKLYSPGTISSFAVSRCSSALKAHPVPLVHELLRSRRHSVCWQWIVAAHCVIHFSFLFFPFYSSQLGPHFLFPCLLPMEVRYFARTIACIVSVILCSHLFYRITLFAKEERCFWPWMGTFWWREVNLKWCSVLLGSLIFSSASWLPRSFVRNFTRFVVFCATLVWPTTEWCFTRTQHEHVLSPSCGCATLCKRAPVIAKGTDWFHLFMGIWPSFFFFQFLFLRHRQWHAEWSL